jgi:hypothetical protein
MWLSSTVEGGSMALLHGAHPPVLVSAQHQIVVLVLQQHAMHASNPQQQHQQSQHESASTS